MGRTAKSKSEMAAAYGVSIVTLRRWLKKIGISNQKKLFNSMEIELIENHFGEPDYDRLIPKPTGNA